MTTPGYPEVLLSLVLVAVSIAITLRWRIPVARDMALGSVRAFIQLVAVGYALHYLFDLQSLWLVFAAIMVMVTVGAQVGASRAQKLRGAFLITLTAMTVGSLATLAVMLVFRIIELEARYVIPLAGMIISNSMNASALTINRLSSDLRGHPLAIETALALGRSWREASRRYQREAATAGMISILNFMKTVGIVALPGAMTGMILAGADPLDAVLLQVIVAYMLLSAVALTSIVTVELTVRKFFTRNHQLRRDV